VKTIRKATSISTIVGLTLAGPIAVADGWTCEQSGLTRQVTLYYPDAPATLPCEVYYSKPSENALPKRLWSARNEAGYCERKAREFVATLEQLGWSCAADGAETSTGDAAAADQGS